MSDCPECDPIHAEWERLTVVLAGLIAAQDQLRQAAKDIGDEVQAAHKRVVNAQHMLNVSMANYAASSSYAHSVADAAQVGGHPDR